PLDGEALDLAQLRQVLGELRRPPRPVVPEDLLGPVALVLRDGRRLRGNRRIRLPLLLRLLQPLAQGRIALRMRPEAVPATLRSIQLDAQVVDRRQVAEAGAHVDV